MPEARHRIEVAAAVIHDAAGRFLLAQRPPGKAFEGYWEFPGGKVEPGESTAAAMCRELHEELGITVDTVHPWLTRDFEYPHASVRLRFFRVYAWRGEPHGREGQQFSWQTPNAISVAPILPANDPILRALTLPDVYGITQATAMGIGAFNIQLAAALANGLRLIQVREKTMPPGDLRQFAAHVVAQAHQHGAHVLINGDVQLARDVGADGVHLTSAQLQSLTQRPDCAWVAASCHSHADIEAATRLGVDFAVAGPVAATPTHPHAPLLGWDGFTQCIADTAIPVYALGGMRIKDVPTARQRGAQGVAMLRGAWQR